MHQIESPQETWFGTIQRARIAAHRKKAMQADSDFFHEDTLSTVMPVHKFVCGGCVYAIYYGAIPDLTFGANNAPLFRFTTAIGDSETTSWARAKFH